MGHPTPEPDSLKLASMTIEDTLHPDKATSNPLSIPDESQFNNPADDVTPIPKKPPKILTEAQKKARTQKKNAGRKARLKAAKSHPGILIFKPGNIKNAGREADEKADDADADNSVFEPGDIDYVALNSDMKLYGPYLATGPKGQKLLFSLCGACWPDPDMGVHAILDGVESELSADEISQMQDAQRGMKSTPILHGEVEIGKGPICERDMKDGVEEVEPDREMVMRRENAKATSKSGWAVEMDPGEKFIARKQRCETEHKDAKRIGPFQAVFGERGLRRVRRLQFRLCSACWPDEAEGLRRLREINEGMKDSGEDGYVTEMQGIFVEPWSQPW